MAIMTPGNLLKDLDKSLKSVIIFDETITIATNDGDAILTNKDNYKILINSLRHAKYNLSN